MDNTEAQNNNIRVLYHEVQQDRRQLSRTIVRSTGWVIAINVAIWAFFAKEYIDTLAFEGPARQLAWRAWYLFAAVLLCSLVVIFWRWYTHFLDNRLVNLYPELLDYEIRLNPSGGGSLWTHLERCLFKRCTEQQKKELRNRAAIHSLVDARRVGWRGHGTVDIIAGVYLVLMWSNTMVLGFDPSGLVTGISLICLVVFLIAFIWILAACAQVDPSESDIQAVKMYDSERQEGAEKGGPSQNSVKLGVRR